MKSKVLKPRSRTSWFSHSLSSLAVCPREMVEYVLVVYVHDAYY